MISFNRVANELDLSGFDAIIFTSKQAVVYANELNSQWKQKLILAVGKATAKEALRLGANSVYNPTEFYGEELANDILVKFRDKKIVYLRPAVVAFDSISLLQKAGVDAKEIIIYETKCIEYKDRELERSSIVIFTSPSTIKCFFNSFKWDETFKAIVIGKTTLKELDSNIKAFVADEPTIDSCIKKAQNIENI